jgi:hypothetical protein
MSNDAVGKRIEDLLRVPAGALKDKLSPALEDIRRYGIGRLLEEYPDFLARLLNKLKQMDAARGCGQIDGSLMGRRGFSGRSIARHEVRIGEGRTRPPCQYRSFG